jgi:glycosyltransferase involved in cell wall biosynthesis
LPVDVQAEHRLVLLGVDGWDDARLRARVREVGLQRRVIFGGRVKDEDLPGWYQRARVFVFPSLHEGYGLPVLEAMACGTPVLAGDIPALREVGGDAASYVCPSDTAALARALEDLLRDPELRVRGLERRLARARQFSWRATAAATHAVYAQLAA